MSTFSIDRPFLQDILRDIESGRIQLPDFQRDWVWDDQRIRNLLASVSQAFPIGAVLLLETGNTDVRFKARPIEGIDSVDVQNEPTTLILDGQQRLTTLFQSLMSGKPVSIRDNKGNEKPPRWYYIDMKQSLKPSINREETVISCGTDRQLHTPSGIIDLSSVKNQYANDMFPVHKIFDSADWRMQYSDYWKYDSNKSKFFNRFESEVIECFRRYNVPVIQLRNETPREAVCVIFEKVNTGGVTLTVFELLTATFAAEEFDLREDWKQRAKRLRRFSVLKDLDNTNFLRALSLLVKGSCARRDLLQLDVQTYTQNADSVEFGFVEAAEFLNKQKIFNAKDVPYQTQLVPLAAILANMGNDGRNIGVQEKISYWYWCGVFGEIYAGSTDTRASNDFSEVLDWIRGNTDKPTTIQEANFQTNRILELRTRGSAAYKGTYALLIAKGCHDFLMERTTEDMERSRDDIDIHHIFPRAWCKKENIEKEVYDSIINKTPLSARANRKIGGCAPSKYLPRIQEDAGIDDDAMDEILASHLISADALRADDFWSFYEARKKVLLEAIEKVMGKKVIRDGDEALDPSA